VARVKGASARSGTADWPLLRGQVSPAAKSKAATIARRLGIPVGEYLDELLQREELDGRGVPVWWRRPIPLQTEELPLHEDDEELPLKSA